MVDEIGGLAASRPSQRMISAPNAGKVSTAFDVERATFDLVNHVRASKGLEELLWNEQIAEIARLHSRNMASYQFFSHKGIDGTMVDDRAEQFGLANWYSIGENIAYMRGFDDPAGVAVEKWMQSTSHRRNVLTPNWKESAIGVSATSDGTYYFTQVFIIRK